MNELKVITYDAAFAKAYADLNREWIEKHFRIEPMDVKQLEHPELIIEQGGEIFFVVKGDEALGTCAMIPTAPGEYELAKMAVSPVARGLGLGDLLMTTIITWARKKKAHTVMLHSNTALTPAMTLYQKHGFKTVHLGPHPDYERANIEMKIKL